MAPPELCCGARPGEIMDTKQPGDAFDNDAKVNYGKVGDLLAEVRAVTGGTDED